MQELETGSRRHCTLKSQKDFTYIGQTIAYNNSNWAAVYQNLRKAWRRWVMVARLLLSMGATVRSLVMMYKLVSQSVILYIREIWVVTGEMLKFM